MNRKRIMPRRVLFAVAALVWMAIIFYFSAQSGTQSTAVSSPLAQKVAAAIHGGVQSEALAAMVEVFLRKAAHFTVYALLAVAVYGFWGTFPLSLRSCALRTLAVCAAYATGDELHQLLVPGRFGCVQDVLLDVCGVACVLGCALLWNKHKRKRK